MKKSCLIILLGFFLSACGSADLDDRYFSGESESWTGEILLELKPTTEPTFENANVELTYRGEGEKPDTIEVRTIKQYNIPETVGDVSPNDDGIYYKRYGNYGLEGAYANGGNFGLMITWDEGEEKIYFEEEFE